MITKRRLFLFFALFLVLSCATTIRAQSVNQSSVGIALSEYCVANIGLGGSPQSDAFGNRSDWVEIYSTFSSPVNLGSYYLSNDKNNLFKWKFPSSLVIYPNQYKIIWLTGKNTNYGTEYHTNFTIEQCKKQWLILSTSQGSIRDSVLVQRSQAGHSHARVDLSTLGRAGWKVFTMPTFSIANIGNSYIDYAPQPIIRFTAAPLPTYTGTSAGGFFPSTGGMNQASIYLDNGVPFDSLTTCFRIYYTLETGDYPVPGAPGTFQLLDTVPLTLTQPASIVRAIAIPQTNFNPNVPTPCESQYLPSFCETNTFFTDDNYQQFSDKFGVVSLAMNLADTSWLNSSGSSNNIVVHAEYYDNKKQVCEGYTQINRPVQEAWLTKQKGFYMTIDDRRGFGCNFEGRIFNLDSLGTTERTEFPTLHLKAGDYESHSLPVNGAATISRGTAILDVFLQSLAARNNLNVNPLHIKPVITFLNGKYQGVYDLREVYDKHYEKYYHQQSPDSLDLLYYHGVDGAVTYFDGPGSNFSPANTFATTVYTLGTNAAVISNPVNYNKLFSLLDKSSFMDYMILNSFAMNGNLLKYDYDIAYARGGQLTKPGYKWHYYLWNTPAIFNFTALTLPNAQVYSDVDVSPCFVHSAPGFSPSPYAGNSHGKILQTLMTNSGNPPVPGTGKYMFQLEYKNRYQDLLNGPLKCENLLKQFDYVTNLYRKEMRYQEDGASTPNPSPFLTMVDEWDTNVVIIRRGIEKRCKLMATGLGGRFANCYNLQGPYALSVDVQPPGAGKVKLNSILLDNYIWTGSYYGTTLSFKATPANDTYVFSHWEFKNHTPLNNAPLSLDSVQINFTQADDVVAVFTDKKNDVAMPTGFTPNGDGINDLFQPVGSALYTTQFDMSVWNRWGQEVFRSTDPSRGWDGNYRGQQAQTGVYAYVITYKNIYDESKILKGNLTLLR